MNTDTQKTKHIEHAVIHFTVDYRAGGEDHGALSYEITRKPNGWVERIDEPKGDHAKELMKADPRIGAFVKRVFDLCLEERNGGYAGGYETHEMRANIGDDKAIIVAVRFYIPYKG